MDLHDAEFILQHYRSQLLCAVYDDDPELQSALARLFPDFEYPNYSHMTLREIWQRYKRTT